MHLGTCSRDAWFRRGECILCHVLVQSLQSLRHHIHVGLSHDGSKSCLVWHDNHWCLNCLIAVLLAVLLKTRWLWPPNANTRRQCTMSVMAVCSHYGPAAVLLHLDPELWYWPSCHACNARANNTKTSQHSNCRHWSSVCQGKTRCYPRPTQGATRKCSAVHSVLLHVTSQQW